MVIALKNTLLLDAAHGKKTARIPVWLMRQAGRILPQYRTVRTQMKGFLDLVKTPERAAEVTVQPVDVLGVDAAIIFSDILVVPEAMGLPYEMIEGKGPYFPATVRNEGDLKKLHIANAQASLHYVLEAIKLAKKALNERVPLIGFAGAPWTVFAYMVEGAGSKTFFQAKKMLYTQPALAHQVLQMITTSTIDYLKAQINAGADLIQIFDSWAGILPADYYYQFSLRYIAQICDAIQEAPVTVFAKGVYFALTAMKQLSCNVVGLDWNMDIQQSRTMLGAEKTLQGNLDPCTLYGSFKTIRTATKKMIKAFGAHKYIANLGHGVYPDTDLEKVKCFVETVKA